MGADPHPDPLPRGEGASTLSNRFECRGKYVIIKSRDFISPLRAENRERGEKEKK